MTKKRVVFTISFPGVCKTRNTVKTRWHFFNY